MDGAVDYKIPQGWPLQAISTVHVAGFRHQDLADMPKRAYEKSKWRAAVQVTMRPGPKAEIRWRAEMDRLFTQAPLPRVVSRASA